MYQPSGICSIGFGRLACEILFSSVAWLAGVLAQLIVTSVIYMYLSLSLHIYIYIYIHIHMHIHIKHDVVCYTLYMCMCMCMCMCYYYYYYYIYIYIYKLVLASFADVARRMLRQVSSSISFPASFCTAVFIMRLILR